MRIAVSLLAAALLVGSAPVAVADSAPRVKVKKLEVSSGPRLGVQVTPMTEELRTFFGAGKDAGVLVGRVEPGSPAALAGVQVGDVIVEVDGSSVGGSMDILMRLADKKGGDTAKLSVVRAKKSIALTAKLDDKWVGQAFPGGDFDFDLDPGTPHGKGRLFRFGDDDRVRDLEEKLERLEQRLEKLERR